jgi:hypothetical protein
MERSIMEQGRLHMRMTKKLAVVVIAAALLVGATAPVSAASVCDFEPTTFEMWFYQLFYC